jgi:hypothetical protein
VVTVLRDYWGQTFLHETCKDVVEALPAGDILLDEVEIALENTGVTTGEFGHVQALQQKKEEIEGWLVDNREKVRVFSERVVRSLDRQIAADQRRAEEDVELRKRMYEQEK